MKKLFVATALLLSIALLAQAISSQTEEIGVNASEVPRLISVAASLSFENLVPTHLYSTPIRIDWAVPQSALSNLAESEVIVRVKMEPRTNNSWIYFEKEKGRYKTAYTELRCIAQNGKCTANSTLSQTIVAYYIAPLGAQYPHDDGLRVSAFLVPIEQLQQEAALEQNARAQLSSLAEIAANASAGAPQSGAAAALQASAQVNGLLEQARTLLAEKRFDELKLQIALLQERIAELQKIKQKVVAAQEKANEIGGNALELAGSAGAGNTNETAVEANQTKSTAASREKNSSGTTGFVVNSSTAAATGAVALVMAALLGYAATRRKGARLTQVSAGFELDGEHSMGSGQASISTSREYASPTREKNDKPDHWPG